MCQSAECNLWSHHYHTFTLLVTLRLIKALQSMIDGHLGWCPWIQREWIKGLSWQCHFFLQKRLYFKTDFMILRRDKAKIKNDKLRIDRIIIWRLQKCWHNYMHLSEMLFWIKFNFVSLSFKINTNQGEGPCS